MAVEIVSGVGARYGIAVPIDSDGLPVVAVSQAAPHVGTLFEGIKTWEITDGQVQRFTHYGDDQPFAQDSLAPAEAGSFVITTAKSNLKLDAGMEGNKVVSAGQMKMRAGNTDKKGNEPQHAFFAYRQALDTAKASPTSGKKRQYNGKIYASARITPVTQAMQQGITDKTYQGTPTPVTVTPWGELMTENTYGNTRGEYIETNNDYHPRINWWLGTSTRTAYELSHAPASGNGDYLHVWVAGTLIASFAGVNQSITNPSFTLAGPVPDGKIVAIVETPYPGNS